MISLRKILRSRNFPLDLLPSSSANFMSIPICNRLVEDESINCRLQLNSFRNFVTVPRRQFTGDQIARSKQADLCEKNELHFRRLVIRSFMFWTMVKLSRLLLDMDHFTDLKKEGDIMCYEFWLAVLEHPKTPLGIELKEKVQNSGISYEKFCRSIVKIFSESKDYCCFSRKDIHITPDDMLDIIDQLNLNRTDYESLKILFSLHEIHGIKF